MASGKRDDVVVVVVVVVVVPFSLWSRSVVASGKRRLYGTTAGGPVLEEQWKQQRLKYRSQEQYSRLANSAKDAYNKLRRACCLV